MCLRYIPEKVERFIQKKCKDSFISNNENSKTKFYCLSMFPYPSGNLHMGHIRNYALGDIIAGYSKLNNFITLNPIGWDSFGMPAENAAHSNKITPEFWTENNIKKMRRQLKKFGFNFNWECEIKTSDPNYYKWEQLFFIKLYKSGLVYQKMGFVNWDPVDKTVLANEQVINGRGWRSDALIERVKINQWYIKITDYAEMLFDDIDFLKDWPKKVKDMQKNWIGKSKLFNISFAVVGISNILELKFNDLLDFMLLDTVVLFKEHVLFDIIKDKNYSENYIIQPITKKYIKLVLDESIDTHELVLFSKSNMSNIILGDFSPFRYVNAKILRKVLFFLLGQLLVKQYIYNLQDWCISRQRYWGAPIPFIHCNNCGTISENENRLPVLLPDITDTLDLNLNLKNFDNFYKIKCYYCNSLAVRETDTFDTFFESSWYYIKYLCPNFISSKILNKWLPVDQYIGGIEHATMHLIYARFFHKVMNDFGIVSSKEPFTKLLTQGMVLMHGSKMSKSKGNIPNQEELIEEYGSDTLRLFIIFSAPAENAFEWQLNGIVGCRKFLEKIWREGCSYINLFYNKIDNVKLQDFESYVDLIKEYNDIICSIKDILNKTYSYNVIISFLMKLMRLVDKTTCLDLRFFFFKSLLIILSPIAPHVTRFIWYYILCINDNLTFNKFPDIVKINDVVFNLEILVFINNKFKGKLMIGKDQKINDLKELVLSNEIFSKILMGKSIEKIVYKKNKMISILVI